MGCANGLCARAERRPNNRVRDRLLLPSNRAPAAPTWLTLRISQPRWTGLRWSVELISFDLQQSITAGSRKCALSVRLIATKLTLTRLMRWSAAEWHHR